MAQRTVALCGEKLIGIETIYTIVNGQQINIPEKVEKLRAKSRNNELFCPCGCGVNLVLVAGDRNLREQHFRMKDGNTSLACNMNTEGKMSVDSKIVLKCWLDDKLKATDIESRIQIHAVDDISRKYEFSFLSKSRKIALSYCHERANLSDEKLEILESNSQEIHIIYIIDCKNGGSVGQYPERLIKIQRRQGYYLLLAVDSADYNKAKMSAAFQVLNIEGKWEEKVFAEGLLKDFSIDDDGQVIYKDELLSIKQAEVMDNFKADIERKKVRRAEEERQRAENLKRRLKEEEENRERRRKQQEEVEQSRKRQAEEIIRRREEFKEKQKLEAERQEAEKRQREEDFKRNMESNFSQQKTQIMDADGNRWIKCKYCGKKGMERDFDSYGGAGEVNLGICRECRVNNPTVKRDIEEKEKKISMKYNFHICPICGSGLLEKSGRYGKFMGCSKFPKCKYTRS